MVRQGDPGRRTGDCHADGAAVSTATARYALFFMFQKGITSGIATMSERVSR